MEKEVVVSKPTVEARYDLVLDDHGKLSRVQVKYAGDERGGAVNVDLRKETRNNGQKRVYTSDEVDAILLYVPKIDRVLWLGADLFHNRKSISIRLTPTVNGQKQGIIFAESLGW